MTIRNPISAFVLVALTASLAACGGSSGPTGPTYPNVKGTYSGAWSVTETDQNTGGSGSLSCAGSVTIATQSQSTIGGSFIIQGSSTCGTSTSGTISGTVQTDGGVAFGLTVPGSNPNGFEAETGCVVTSGDSKMNGTITGGTMSVSATFFATCPDGSGGTFPAKWVFGFNG